MNIRSRSILDEKLEGLRRNIIQLSDMANVAIEKAITSLGGRDVALASEVINGDEEINQLRYKIEEESLQVLATQQPAARDLRTVIAAIHIAVELERIGDHAAGIARLVRRIEREADIETLHQLPKQLPKMAMLASEMIDEGVTAFIDEDTERAYTVIGRDDKIDRQYFKLFRRAIKDMGDEAHVRRATYLLWIGHNLERIADRATNIAERVIFMASGEFVEIA